MQRDLLERARRLVERHPDRALLGLVGPPGAGKSTLAAALVATLDREGILAAVVPMDGFHLARSALAPEELARRGAPDTFDAMGYLALLVRLRRASAGTVWAPDFRRRLEEPIAGAIAVPASVRIVVTEGNYLLDTESPWSRVRELLDEVWYLDLDPEERRRRLVARHVAAGRELLDAARFVAESDERNAERVAATRDRADLIIHAPAG